MHRLDALPHPLYPASKISTLEARSFVFAPEVVLFIKDMSISGIHQINKTA